MKILRRTNVRKNISTCIIFSILTQSFLPLYMQSIEASEHQEIALDPNLIVAHDSVEIKDTQQESPTRAPKSQVLANLIVRRSAELGTLVVNRSATVQGNLRTYGALTVNGPTYLASLTVNGSTVLNNVTVNGTFDVVPGTFALQELELLENPVNGTNAITLKAPADVPADYTLELPPNAGNVNDVLVTNGAGVLSWQNAAAVTGAFVQGGNTFGATGQLGTNDNYGLDIKTHALNRVSIANTGVVTVADLVGTGDRLVEASSAGVLKAQIPTGTKNIIYVVQNSPTVVGKFYPTLKDAVDWANAHATTSTAIVMAAGDHPVAATISVTNTWVKAIVGAATTATRLLPTGALLGQPVFSFNQPYSAIPFLMSNFTITGAFTPGFMTTPGSLAVITSGNSRLMLDMVFIAACYRGIQATGGTGVGLQLVILNNCFVVFSADCGVLADNGARIAADDAVISESGVVQVRIMRTSGLAVPTQFTMAGGQLSNETTFLGDGILAKDVSLVRISNIRSNGLQNIFTVQDNARLECTNNIEIKSSVTHYRQMTPTAVIMVSGDIVYGHDASKFVITNSANVGFNIVDATTGERCIGSFTDQDNFLFTILTGHGDDDPYYHYENDWFGLRGLVADIPENALTGVNGGMKTISTFNKHATIMSLVRGLNAHSNEAGIELATYASDGDPSSADLALLRFWNISKEATTHNLSAGFWDGATQTKRLVVTPAGNVGLGGVTAPTSTLEIGSGQIAVHAGTSVNPSLALSTDLDTGIYFPAGDVIGFAASGAQRMAISGSGVVTIPGLSAVGVVHTDISGNLSTSPIVNSDITNLTITDAKLATIASAGKVANTATTAASANTASAIVARDSSGNFSAGTITASLAGNVVGNVTGQASANVLKTGDTITGPLVLSGGSTDLTVGGTTDLQALDVNGNFHALSTSYFDLGVPGLEQNVLEVTTGPLSGPNQFNSIGAALAFIGGSATVTNPFVIKVGPGIYEENTLNLLPYVAVVGEAPTTTFITPINPNDTIIVGAPDSLISNVTLSGATAVGAAAIAYNGGSTVGVFRITNVIFGDNDILINQDNTDGFSTFILTSVSVDSTANFSTGIKVRSTTPAVISRLIGQVLTWEAVANASFTHFVDLSGTTASVFFSSLDLGSIDVSIGGIACQVVNGALLTLLAGSLSGFATAIDVPNAGSGPILDIAGISTHNNSIDLEIDHPGATGTIAGVFAQSKMVIDPSAVLSVFVQDPVQAGTITIGTEFVGTTANSITNVTVEHQQGAALGVIEGGELSDAGSLDVSVSAGTGYLMVGSAPNDNLKYIEWNTQTISLVANADNFIYVDNAGIVQSSLARPDSITTILIGKARTESASIAFLQIIPSEGQHPGNGVDETLREGFGPVYKSGSLVSKNGDLQLNVNAGNYFFGTINYLPAGGTAISWESFYSNGSGNLNVINGVTSVDYDHYDDGSGTLATIPLGEYARHAFYIVNDGVNEQYMLVYGQQTYTTLLAAQNGTIPPEPGTWTDNIALIASIIVQNTGIAANQIAEIRDERPRLGFKASGVSVITEHNDLSGRGLDDCHPQYLLLSGTNSMVGTLNMATNTITNAGTINGVTIQAHASRHLPNGADPLTTATPVTISTSNAEGIANSFARSDHVHNHGNLAGGSLHAVATSSTAGFMSAADKTLLDSVDPALYVLKAGSTMTGALNINTASNALVISTDKFIVNGTSGNTTVGGALTLSPLTTAGILHNNVTGLVTSSRIVNADVDPAAAIDDTKLATITTAGKVANGATTADSNNTPNAIVLRDGSGNFKASNILLENQGQLQLQEQTINGANTVSLQAPDDLSASYTLTVPPSGGTSGYVMTTNGAGVLNWTQPAALSGLVITGGNSPVATLSIGTFNDFPLNIITNNTSRIHIGDSIDGGAITLTNLASTGVVHTDGSGLLSTSSIVNADISAIAAIDDTKLATIATLGKVANTATTAITSNNPSTIVLRDASGNFSAGTITAAFTGNLTGTVTGAATLNVLKAGDTMTGNLVMDNQKQLRLRESTASGVNYIALQAPASVTADTVLTFPDGPGNANQVLTSLDGTGLLSWTTATSANTASAIVARDGSGNFSAGTITASLSGNATTATTATNFSGSLVGDVTGTQGATVVSTVGGQTAANVAAGTVLANNATSANTVSQIVRRDASGNFVAGTITASLTGAASLNVLKAGDTMSGALVLPAGTAAAPSLNFTGSTTTGLSAAVADTLVLGTAGSGRISISSGGAVTVNAPTTGVGLAVTGNAASTAQTITAGTGQTALAITGSTTLPAQTITGGGGGALSITGAAAAGSVVFQVTSNATGTNNTAVFTGNNNATDVVITPGTNQKGLTMTGNGTANAVEITAGGGTGGGILITGGAGAGVPLQVTAAAGTGSAATITGGNSATAMTVTPGTNQIGFTMTGNGTANAMQITAGAGAGGAISLIGGAGAGVPLQVTAAAGTGSAATFTGNNTSTVMTITPGTNKTGLAIATSGTAAGLTVAQSAQVNTANTFPLFAGGTQTTAAAFGGALGNTLQAGAPRFIWASVSSTGALVQSGGITNLTVLNPAPKNVYTITYSGFSAAPIVVATPVGVATSAIAVVSTAPTTTQVIITTFSASGTAAAVAFDLIIMGLTS